MRENLDDELTEVKSENAIDRITSQANPRTLERVPAGARFHVRMVLDVLCAEDRELLPRLVEGLRLLEDDSLGGGGSRGSGRVALLQSEADLARARLLCVRRAEKSCWPAPIWRACRRWSRRPISRKNSPSRHAPGIFQLELRGSLSARWVRGASVRIPASAIAWT